MTDPIETRKKITPFYQWFLSSQRRRETCFLADPHFLFEWGLVCEIHFFKYYTKSCHPGVPKKCTKDQSHNQN